MTGPGSRGATTHIDTFIRDRLPSAPAASLRRVNGAVVLLDAMVGAGHADRPALYFGDEKWTYVELMERSNRIARVLVEDCDLVPGEWVLLCEADHGVAVAAWFAVLKAGGIAVNTPPGLRLDALAEAMTEARLPLAICHRDQKIDLTAEHLRHLLFFGDGASDGLEARMALKPATFDNVDTAADDPAMILFPEAAVQFHHDIAAAADGFIRKMVQIRPGDIVCGVGLDMATTMAVGASSVLVEGTGPESLLAAVARFRATVCFASAAEYVRMLDHVNGYDISSLRACVVQHGPPPAAVAEAWQRKTGLRLINLPGPGARAGMPLPPH